VFVRTLFLQMPRRAYARQTRADDQDI